MRLSDFDYDLPPERIAQYPSPDRSASQLLYREAKNGVLKIAPFSGLENLVSTGDLVVVNDTRVIPARLQAEKPTGGQVEIMLERILDEFHALVQLRSNKAVKSGQILCGDSFQCVAIDRQDRFFRLRFESNVAEVFRQYAAIPLPPYIKRSAAEHDNERYQTVYADQPGAVAAPTAGLHFDLPLIERLRAKGVGWDTVTLHVGAGTFLPVQAEEIADHKMHEETLEVSIETCNRIAETKARGGKVIAIGTTVVRALETAASSGSLMPYAGETSIFITPGYQCRVVDQLITNFHLPKSTLLMLVSAFAGYDTVMQFYQFAIDNKLRFFSYGDAMLLSREDKNAV